VVLSSSHINGIVKAEDGVTANGAIDALEPAHAMAPRIPSLVDGHVVCRPRQVCDEYQPRRLNRLDERRREIQQPPARHQAHEVIVAGDLHGLLDGERGAAAVLNGEGAGLRAGPFGAELVAEEDWICVPLSVFVLL